jgi:amidase
MPELFYETARALARRIRRRELSSRELLDAFLGRIERLNPKINAIVTLDIERARAAAERADAAAASGEPLGPLHGVPMTVKDAFEVAGLRTTSGTRLWKDHVPATDALVVARLRAAGAIIFGKTNTPRFCADWQSFNALFGTTNNPWDTARTPGGSSGGAAAALASGFTPLELGSDIGGSIRIPSSFCGVYGHKPTYELVPATGHLPGPPGKLAPPDLNVVGPLARSTDDLMTMLDVIAGPPPDRAKAYTLSLPAPRASTLRGYRAAVWFDDPAFPIDLAVQSVLQASAETLRKAGVTVDEVHPEFELAEAHRLYRRLFDPTMAAGIPPQLLVQLEAAAAAPDAEKPDTAFARNALSRHADWLAAHEQRAKLRATLARFFRDYDVLLCPVAPVTAFEHDHREPQSVRALRVNGQNRPYADMMGWVCIATAAWHPATSMPVGLSADGMPVGLQVIGPYLEDRTPIDFAGRLSELVGGFQPAPQL